MDYRDYKAGFKSDSFWFKGKRDLLNILIKKNYKKKKLKILSVGIGTGDELEILKKYGQVYAIDTEQKSLDLIPDGVCEDKRLCDACSIIYKDNFFDLVVSLNVLEYITDFRIALKEISRVLKKNGIFIFVSAAHPYLFGSHDKAIGHVRRFKKQDLKMTFIHMLLFSEWKLHYWNSILFYPLVLVRFLKKNSEAELDNQALPEFLDSMLYSILKLENLLIKRGFYFPIGLNILGICKK